MKGRIYVVLLLFVWISAVDSRKASNRPSNHFLKRFVRGTSNTVDTCGIPKVVVEEHDRIVGGRDASLAEFPWMASLRVVFPFIEPTHMCGATILNSLWVITAAHCVDGWSPIFFEVAVGVDRQSEKGIYFSSHAVDEFIAHEGFDEDTFLNDIALIKLKTPILFAPSNGNVNGICLPDSGIEVDSGEVIATGWGDTKEDGNSSDVLQAVELPLVPRSICEEIFGGKDVITSTMICAGEPQGGVDTCQGDSGGPLIRRNEDGRFTLVGIVSWGVGCARPGLPGIYTLVSVFINWINEHMT